MEVNSENGNSGANISNIIDNNQSNNISNSQEKENSKKEEVYPFQLITKGQEKHTPLNLPNIQNNIDQQKLKIDLQKIERNAIPEEDEDSKNKKKKKSFIKNAASSSDNPKTEKSKNQKAKKKINLNSLSPDVYMRKKFSHTEQNINPLEIKLKRIEQDIKKQYDYDYKRVMQQIKDRLEVTERNKKQQKHILEEEKKLKEKIKTMEEYRENVLKEKAKKVFKKQNKSFKKLKKDNKTSPNIILSSNTNSNTSNYNSNYSNTIESSNNKKLPPISNSLSRYKIIRERKEQNEKQFILDTKEDILSLELEHKENLLYQQDILNKKIKGHSKLYEERNEAYLKYRKDKEREKNENYLEKDIKRRYNIKLNILRDKSEKNGRLKDKIQKNLENFQEKREILEKNEKKKIRGYLKKMNKYNGSKSMIHSNEKRIYYSNLQKNNIINNQKELEEKYNDFLWNMEYIKNIASDMQKVDSDNRKNLYQNNLQLQTENEKKCQSFYDFLEKIEKKNINNKTDNAKLKLYNKKVREEIEEKNRREEELNK